MRILFTGASSFTGYWFVRELSSAGHEVVATFRRRPEEYADPLRRERVTLALPHCQPVFGCSFGDPAFLEVAGSQRWDLFCHHAADVTNYKSPDFDVVAALANNTRNTGGVLEALRSRGSDVRVLVTGSVFENDEGAGSEGLPAFSPYGLSKSFTWQVFRYYAQRAGISLGKFIIPNPFGPYEEPRFTAYLMKTWFAGNKATVSSPAYVRDNIHVSLLAMSFVKFAERRAGDTRPYKSLPSGYAESQGAFALRFATEMRSRLGLACALELLDQTEFPEPRVRINTEPAAVDVQNWREPAAWDELAQYYKSAHR